MSWLSNAISSIGIFMLEYKYAILFYIVIALIVYLKRSKFEKQGIAFLLRTKIGINLMERMSQKHRQFIRILGLSAIGFAFSGLVLITIIMIDFVSKYFTTDLNVVGVAPVIPGFPVAGTGLVLPLVVGWICFFIIMVVHEFSHGVVARAFNVPVKSSGIAFFGPFLGAFVEPDEKALAKRPQHEQYALYAAGPVSNILFMVIFWLLASLISGPMMEAISHVDGIEIAVNDETKAMEAGLISGDVVYAVNGISTLNITIFDAAAAQLKPGEKAVLTTARGDFTIDLATHPEIPIRGYMGINRREHRVADDGFALPFYVLKWLDEEFFYWLILLSFGIGIINLFPIYITDGARMLKIGLEGAYPNSRAKRYWVMANNFCLFLLLLMVIVPAVKFFL